MNSARSRKESDSQPISLEELARRMMAMPPKARTELVKKKAKPRKKK